MSSQYPTHTERNHRRAQRFEARKATYNQPTIDAQAQELQQAQYELRTLLIDAKDYNPNNPALLKAHKGGWLVNGGAGGRGKVIARTATQTLDDALYVAALVKDAGYHIINSDLLTAE